MPKIRWCHHESAQVKLTNWEDGFVTVSSLSSTVRQKGHARQLMEKVAEWADENNYTLILQVGQFGHPIGPDNDILIKFYESLGFVIATRGFVVMDPNDKKVVMMRKPRDKNKPYNDPS